MIEHQEDRDLMINEDNDDESDISPALSSKGEKIRIRRRFRGKLSLSILGVLSNNLTLM